MLRETLFAAVLCAVPTFADTVYWYNGDFDGNSGLVSEQGGVGDAFTYDDFNVGAGGVTLTGLFANDFTNTTITQASWEIRSGVSSGNGGTLIASGTSSATVTDTGISDFGLELENVLVSGLNISLSAGTYWLGIAPLLSGNVESFVATTSGLNAVGSPMAQDGNAFLNGATFSANFAAASDFITVGADSANGPDFSEGVMTSSTPEPSTGMLVGGAAILAGLFRFRTRSKRA
jgi:hypothetical protein